MSAYDHALAMAKRFRAEFPDATEEELNIAIREHLTKMMTDAERAEVVQVGLEELAREDILRTWRRRCDSLRQKAEPPKTSLKIVK